MVKRIMTGVLVLLSLSYGCLVHADMGRVYAGEAKVSEEGQKAIILHNLEEEILILGTDLVSDRKTKILRFISFPSEPQVALAQPDALDVAAELIKKHELKFLFQSTKSRHSPVESESVELKFNAKLGAHDVTVIKVNDTAHFRQWVNSFFKEKGLPTNESYPDVEDVVEDYLKRGINYFVFDLVEITDTTHLIEPVMYRFESKKLYYPLKTTNTFGGEGGIDLIIISPVTLCDPLYSQALYIPEKELYALYPCMSALCNKNLYGSQVSTSAEISRAEVESIYAPAGNFFNEKECIFIQLIQYYGKYSFDDDILIDIFRAPREEVADVSFDAKINEFLKSIPPATSVVADEKEDTGLMLKKACLKATMAAIEMETDRFEQKLKAAKEGPGNPQNIPDLEKRIRELDAAYEKYEEISPTHYTVPEKKTVKVKVTHAYQEGSILKIKHMSRSGPFYHVAGIEGNDYESLKTDKTYQMAIYLVYPRDYPFTSHYVYIEDFK